MISPHRRICAAALLPLTLCVSLGFSGCQIGRTFFQMDSDAPVPFFGMDLLPKGNKTSPTDGVSRFQSESASVDVEPIAMSKPQPTSKAPIRWANLLGRTAKNETLTLPSATGPEQIVSDAPVEQFR